MLPIGSNRIPRRRAAPLWTKQDTRRLKRLWSRGRSAAQIARALPSGVSRSAVLGKIYRLGIAASSPNSRGRRPWLAATKGDASQAARSFELHLFRSAEIPAWVTDAAPYVDDPLVDADIPVPQRRSLLESSGDTCRWPVGDPARPGFFFCGAEPLKGKPYCAAHCARGYLPKPKRARWRWRHRIRRARPPHWR
jgi:GcrA cell cycle regulator